MPELEEELPKGNLLKGKLPKRMGEMTEKEFEMIIPDADNSSKPIDKKIHKEIITKINDRFGGVTNYQDVIGCERKTDKPNNLNCEPATSLKFTRDWDDPYTKELMREENLTKEQLLEKDREFVLDMGKDVADRLGQFGVFTDEENTDAELAFGKWRKRADEEYRAEERVPLEDVLLEKS